jgi:hypothetical protein
LSLRGGGFPPKQSFCGGAGRFGAKPVLSLPQEPPLAVTFMRLAEQLRFFAKRSAETAVCLVIGHYRDLPNKNIFTRLPAFTRTNFCE